MKRCPTCTRTFLDEQLSYCTDDGTPLVEQQQSSSFDPQATILDQTPPSTNKISSPAPTRPFRADDVPSAGWPSQNAWPEPSTPTAPPSPPPSWATPYTPPTVWTPPPPPVGRFTAKTQQNPVAIASLAVGVFSMTIGLCCYAGLGTGPIAIVLGVVAMVQMKDGNAQPASKGMAIAGIATGAVAFGIIMLLFILGIAVGNLR